MSEIDYDTIYDWIDVKAPLDCCAITNPTPQWARATLATLLFGDLERDWPVADRQYIPRGDWLGTFVGSYDMLAPEGIIDYPLYCSSDIRMTWLTITSPSLDVRSAEIVSVHLRDEMLFEGTSLGNYPLRGRRAYQGDFLTVRVRNKSVIAHTFEFAVEGYVRS